MNSVLRQDVRDVSAGSTVLHLNTDADFRARRTWPLQCLMFSGIWMRFRYVSDTRLMEKLLQSSLLHIFLRKAKPVFKKLPGWKTDIRGIRKYEDLPENCRNYIEFVEKEIGYPITMISNGPGREDIIYRNK